MKYRSDIEGLRALAVIPVILFHAGVSWCGGGYIGVDIFFVISGFVIAKSLEADLEAGEFSLMRFYAKRIRRIFPALFATILLTWCAGLFIFLPDIFENFSKSIVASSTFISNFYFWKSSGYFSPSALSQPLLHTWSLSVEEQYYIFAPIFTYVVFTYFGKRWLSAYIPVIIVSFILSAAAISIAPTANFYLIPTRTWELLLGALLAHRMPAALPKKWMTELVGGFGFALILYAIFMFEEATPFPGPNALFPCIGAALLIYAGTHHSSYASKILSLPPATIIGKLSYSLYLMHWPVIVFAYLITLDKPSLAQVPVILLVTFALAYLSWRFVEQPFRVISVTRSGRKIVGGGVLAIIVFCILGGAGIATDGFAVRYPDYKHEKIAGNDQWRRGSCFLNDNPDIGKWSKDACVLTLESNPKALLWGDSFAAQYSPGIAGNNENIRYSVIQYTAAGCPPVLSYHSLARPKCKEFNQNALKIIRDNNIEMVILGAKWTDLQSRGLHQLSSTLEVLDEMGVKVYVLGQSPEFSIDVQILAYVKGDRTKQSLDSWKVFFDLGLNDELREIVGDERFINPMENLCDSAGVCAYRDKDVFLFEDYGHFSVEGSTRAVEKYFPLYQKD